LVDQLVPCIAAMVDDIVIRLEDAVLVIDETGFLKQGKAS
jgi:hypothetical protein